MPLRTKQNYIDSISSMQTNVWAYGEKVDDIYAHPCFKPAVDAIGMVYALSGSQGRNESDGLFTAHSPFTGDRVSRFLHIHQTQDDLKSRFQLSRNLVHRHGACIGARCVSTSVLNAVFTTTFDMDQSTGTDYHARFLKFLGHVQENDLAVAGAMMDVKGDRSLSPHEQVDPDLYLHIVEKRPDGIVVRGAKASISGAAIAEEIVVVPCTALSAEGQDYAVSFAIPGDAPGILHIAEAPAPNMRRLVGKATGSAAHGISGKNWPTCTITAEPLSAAPSHPYTPEKKPLRVFLFPILCMSTSPSTRASRRFGRALTQPPTLPGGLFVPCRLPTIWPMKPLER